MASIVIVTNRCYLLCEAINHISVNEMSNDCKEEEWERRRKKPKKISKATRAKQIENAPYQIQIDFIPTSRGPNANNGRDDNACVSITVYGRSRAMALFGDMVAQIREQIPDQVFLDKLVENFLNTEVKND